MKRPIHVLHVDDEPDFVRTVATFLERENGRFVVETATSASEALDRLAEREFDCVVSDYGMPGRNGLEFLEAVRESRADLPFVLYTGKGSEEVASEAISAGVTDYLQKRGGTGQYAVLANRIGNAVEGYRARRELEGSQQRLSLFFEQSPLGVIEWNEGFEFARLNPAAESILGYAESELRGRSWEAIVPDTDREDVGEVVSGLLENEDGYRSVNENVRGDGERIVCEWHNRVVTDDRGGVVAVFSQFRDVTDRTERERELLRTTRAVDEAPVGISVSDPSIEDNPLIYVNGTFEELTGYDAEAVLGRNCRFLQGEDTDPDAVAELREAIDDREPVSVELLNYRADGTPFWNRVTVAPVEDGTGEVVNFVGFQEDVTERIERERELERERERFHALARTASDAIVVVDTDSTVVYANEAVERVFGHRPEDLEGEPLTRLMPEPFREAHLASFGRYLDTDERDIEWEMVRFPGLHADGHEIPLEVSFSEFESAGERLFAGVIRDVTEREELEAELRAERELLERLFDTSPVGITVIDTDGAIVRANQTAVETLDLERSELLSRTYDDPEWEIFGPDCEPLPPEDLPFSRVMRTREPVEDYRHGIRVDGEVRWLRINAVPLRDGEGTLSGVVSTVQDVTGRIERERELERYETIVQTVTDPVYVLDPDGRFVRVNDAMVETTGYPREELLGSHASMLIGETDVRRGEEMIRALLAGERDHATLEVSFRTADGIRRQYSAGMAILHENGRFEGTVVVAHDVTDLREHQRRLSVFDRVLRHNLRNKMNVVLGNAEELANAADPSVAERAAEIREAATQLLGLSESAREFEGVFRGSPQTATVDVAALVEDVTVEAGLEHPEAVVSTAVPDGAPARAHETFELALEELVENAITHSDREDPSVDVTVGVGDDSVEVCVADDGPGLGETDRRALVRGIESPLEHTQGLGLWLVRWSVESVGGEVEFAENEPRGTVVTVRLPRAERRDCRS